MYIIFDEKGNEQLRYFLDELPEDFKNDKYIKLDSEKDIPKKEGYRERAALVDDKIKWEYEKIEEPIDPEEKIIELEEHINILSDTLDFLLSEGGEI